MTDLAAVRDIDAATVWKGDRPAGRLLRTGTGVRFEYDPAYLRDGAPAVASTLPRRAEPYATPGGSIPPFFAGLIPEGARLHAIVRAVKTSLDDELSLLLAVGSDTVGDVAVTPEGSLPRPLAPPGAFPDAGDFDFDALFRRSIDPDAGALDVALPGVQEKLSDAVISLPVSAGGGPSILKLNPPAYPRLVENEAFFLEVARAVGFEVPRFRIVHDRTGASGLLVERFDRAVTGDAVARIAQEDACQLAGRWPADKYRMPMREVVDAVARVVSAPRAAALHLVGLVAFSYAIGNGDLHGKNVSVRWLDGERIVLPTPVYDVVSTTPYRGLDDRLALRVDGRDLRIKGADLVSFAGHWDLPRSLVERRVAEMVDRLRPALDGLDSIGLETGQTERLAATVRTRTAELLTF